MYLYNIRLFVDVIQSGNFASAARLHNIDPSSVSRSISNLETDLGFRLFQRSTRRIVPTEAGSVYYEKVEKLVDSFDQAGEQAMDLISQPKGVLRITACTSFGQRMLAPILPKLMSRYPELTIDLVLSDNQVNLIDEKIDLAIRFGEKPEGDFVATELTKRQFKICASPSYLEKNSLSNDPRCLEQHNCLLFPMYGYNSEWKFRQKGKPAFKVPVKGHLYVSHGMTMTACAVSGLGPSLLPDWLCQEEINAGTLVNLFPDYDCTPTKFNTSAWLIYPSRDYMSAKLRIFIDFLKQEVIDHV
jgi:DNA-binding transcriptional LysR family regulator